MRRIRTPYEETSYQILVLAQIKGSNSTRRTSVIGNAEEVIAWLQATIETIRQEN